MINARMNQQGLNGKAIQGSMLTCPFPDEIFDSVVSIGCCHHTGDTQRCIDETWRVLRSGGHAYLMQYNRFSLRQWQDYPRATSRALWLNLVGMPTNELLASEEQRAAYDMDSLARAAPETQFFSIIDIKRMMRRFLRVTCAKENADPLIEKKTGQVIVDRIKLLSTGGKLARLDVYIGATK